MKNNTGLQRLWFWLLLSSLERNSQLESENDTNNGL